MESENVFALESPEPRDPAKKARPRGPKIARPTIEVQSRGAEVIIGIDARPRWNDKQRTVAGVLHKLAIANLGTITHNSTAGGYHNLVADGPRPARPGESRRTAMLRLLFVLKLGVKKGGTHQFKAFTPTSAELGAGLSLVNAKKARKEFAAELAMMVRAGDENARQKREEARVAKARAKEAREKAKAERLAARAEKAAKRKEAA